MLPICLEMFKITLLGLLQMFMVLMLIVIEGSYR